MNTTSTRDDSRVVPDLAITLWPEWAWMICALGPGRPDGLVPKLVENRDWHPGNRLPPGTRIAIHAGKHLGGRSGGPAADEAVASVVHMFRRANPGRELPFDFRAGLLASDRSAIVCTATVDSFDRSSRTGWDVPGVWRWRLRDVFVLSEPVACKGAQGLWPVVGATREALALQVAP